MPLLRETAVERTAVRKTRERVGDGEAHELALGHDREGIDALDPVDCRARRLGAGVATRKECKIRQVRVTRVGTARRRRPAREQRAVAHQDEEVAARAEVDALEQLIEIVETHPEQRDARERAVGRVDAAREADRERVAAFARA